MAKYTESAFISAPMVEVEQFEHPDVGD